MESRQSGFVHGRNIRRRSEARRGRDRIGLDLAALQIRQRIRRHVDHKIDLTRHDILQRRRSAAIGHQLKSYPRRLLEQEAAKMSAGAGARSAGGRFVRIELQPSDELAEVLCRQAGIDDDHVGIAGDQRDRIEVLHHIVWQRVDRAVEHMGAEEPHGDCVAVRCRPGDAAGADSPRGAGHVFNDDGLPERNPHRLGQDARQCIERPACRQRHHDRDGT